ncbi:hypothetical protein, partial [Methylicorpusculum sp.]|uniref:hypothetical protein n=1 Tax=Methylicorpusculum sp. TaxID=2713644 RepID=UPI002727DDB1
VWDVSIEDRREPLHGGLTAAIPAADILASHTPYLHKVNHFLSIKGVEAQNDAINIKLGIAA